MIKRTGKDGAVRLRKFSPITGRVQEILAEDLSPREREEVLEFLYQCLMGKRYLFSVLPSIW